MANDLSVYIPKLIASALPNLRANAVMPNLVTKSYSPTPQQKGDTITIPVPASMTAQDVVPGPYATNPADLAPQSVSLVIDQWKESAFYITQKQLEEINSVNLDPSTYVGSQLSSATIAVANAIDLSLINLYKDVYNVAGSAGTTPFASDPSDAQDCMRILDQNLVPRNDRYMVLDPLANANAVSLPQFTNAYSYNSDIAIKEGLMGRAIGFDWYYDQNLGTHTKGTSSGYLVNQVGHAIGDTTVVVDTGTGTIVAGDVFTVAGDTQTYVVQSFAGSVITYTPAAKTAFANDAAITFKATHAVNLAFHRQAFALALRPMVTTLGNGPTYASMTMQDDVTQIPLKVSIASQHEQYRVSVSALWGVVAVRPECAVRLMG